MWLDSTGGVGSLTKRGLLMLLDAIQVEAGSHSCAWLGDTTRREALECFQTMLIASSLVNFLFLLHFLSSYLRWATITRELSHLLVVRLSCASKAPSKFSEGFFFFFILFVLDVDFFLSLAWCVKDRPLRSLYGRGFLMCFVAKPRVACVDVTWLDLWLRVWPGLYAELIMEIEEFGSGWWGKKGSRMNHLALINNRFDGLTRWARKVKRLLPCYLIKNCLSYPPPPRLSEPQTKDTNLY